MPSKWRNCKSPRGNPRKELKEFQKETDRQFQETNKIVQETSRQLQELKAQVSGVSDNIGLGEGGVFSDGLSQGLELRWHQI